MGIEVLAAAIAAGSSFGGALTATYGIVGAAIIQLGGGLLVATALGRGAVGAQQSTRGQITVQTELPYVRHVVGRSFATGTPSPGVADNGLYYVPYLLNSRPSSGNFDVYINSVLVQSQGDPFDFSGEGATASSGIYERHFTYWIQRGDETGPPQAFLDQVAFDETTQPLGYKPTDAGRDLTIIWCIFRRGGDKRLPQRWRAYPSAPPIKVLGNWSKVWDPRDPAQTAEDTTTHTFSRNQALIGLDLAMRNPFRPYSADLLELDMWKVAADVADQTIQLKNGGTEPRYQCDGTTLFDGGELEQLMDPIMQAGASSLVRSGGRLGIVPGIAKNPALTITDMVAPSLQASGLPTISTVAEPETQFDEVQVTYSPLDRDGESASLSTWQIPGVVPDGLPRVLSLDLGMVESGTQAQRIRNIRGLETTYVRNLSGVGWPETFKAVAGSWVNISLGYEKIDATYELTSISPLASPVGDDSGIAYRMPISARERADAIYEWNPLVDEEDIEVITLVIGDDGVQPPGAITITTGDTVNLNTGGTIIPRVRVQFDPSPTANISTYQIEAGLQDGAYTQSFIIDGGARLVELTGLTGNVITTIADSGDDEPLVIFIEGAAGQPLDIRARANTFSGFSDYSEFIGATPVVDINLDTPIINSLTGGDGQIFVDVSAPNDADVREIEVLQGDTNDPAQATIFYEAATARNEPHQFALTGLGDGEAKFIFARVRGDFASASAFASGSATTDAAIGT